MKRFLIAMLVLYLLLGFAWAEEYGIDWSRPVAALTFDDGPSEYTLSILQTLEAYGGHATFFMVGSHMGAWPETVEAIARSKSEIGTHTWGHETLPEKHLERVRSSLTAGINKITEMTGHSVRFLRPPFGLVDGNVYQVCRQKGLIIIIWSLDSLDWSASSPEEISRRILDNVQNGDIILCHDTKGHTAEAMKTVIPELTARGYQLLTISELFSAYDEDLVSNAKYSRLNLDHVDVHK